MIQALEQAIENIRNLPPDRQLYAAEVLNAVGGQATSVPLTADEIEGIKHAQAQVRRGEYGDAEVAAFYQRLGL